MTQSRDGLIVEIDVRDLDIGWQTVGVDCEIMNVGGDLDLAGGQIFDRLVATAVAEF